MRFIRNLFLLALVAAVAGAAALVGGWLWLDRYASSDGPLREPVTVTLERGSGLSQITRQLAEVGAVERPLAFRLYARLQDRDRALKAGEYRIEPASSPRAILGLLEAGRSITHPITVPEGLTVAEVLAIVEDAEVLDGPLPPPPPEGSLLPETYGVLRGQTREAVVARMAEAMDAAVADAWEGRAEAIEIDTPQEMVVLASIIEKETAVPEEYEVVSAVFHNRLRRGMRLQTDPTVIYALTEGQGPLDRALLRADLDYDHPYNTYVIDGLPPGPIANPGRQALHAAVAPADTDYLYFVADGTGGHAFARTLEEHNRNVAQWRRVQRERGG